VYRIGMARKKASTARAGSSREGVKCWYVYMVRCADDTLYTGVTTDLERRVAEHNAGKAGAKYTRARRPVVLVYHEHATSRAEATRCEGLLRVLPRGVKETLVYLAAKICIISHTFETP
jgi:putative endonuclease